jgi:SOS-response transcriptional repressor LexA
MGEPIPVSSHAGPGHEPPRIAGLTQRQRETLDFIRGFYLECGAAPTCAEIAAHLGLRARQSAHRLVRRLEARGAVTRRRGQARSLAPVLRNTVTLELPEALERAVRVIAQRACTTPEAVIVEAVGERLAGVRASLDAGRRVWGPSPPQASAAASRKPSTMRLRQ